MNDQAKLSAQAARFRAMIEDPNGLLATCDGGDPGNPDKPSIWLLGLEPGWSVNDDRAEQAGLGTSQKEYEKYAIELQLKWQFNRKAFQLLAALNGKSPRSYVDFAQRERPFEQGSAGFLKGNLFPAACNNLGTWELEHSAETGFDSKEDYQRWMRATRFPLLREWVAKCRPKLIICIGLAHLDDFLSIADVAAPPPAQTFEVNGHFKRVHVATGGLAPIAIVPHFTGGSHGLNSYESIAKTAHCINVAMGDAGFSVAHQ